MNNTDLLHMVLQRLDFRIEGALIVTADEIQQWPEDGLAHLLKWNMLTPIQPRKQIECDGCEERCIMPVEPINPESKHADVICDKRDGIGKVPIELERLWQWRIDPLRIATLLNSLLKIDQTPQAIIQDRLWLLGLAEITVGRKNVFFARGINWADGNRIFDEIGRIVSTTEAFLFIPNGARREDVQSHVTIISLFEALFVDNDKLLVDVKLIESAHLQNQQMLLRVGKDIVISASQSNAVVQFQNAQRFPVLPDLRWNEVSIAFVSNDSVKIQAREVSERRTFAEIGFKDRRKGDLPDTRWEVLRDDFAENSGVVSFKNRKTLCDLKAAVKEINQRLRTIIVIQENPISYDKKEHVYKTKFKISDRRYGQ